MSRRDWGHPGVPWYAKREPRRVIDVVTRSKIKAYFERNGSLYGGVRNPIAQDADRPDPEANYAEYLRHEWTVAGVDGFTQADVGAFFGVTKERVAQIEQRALRKLRHPSRSRVLREFL